jgi:DNA-binding response OmpR family regulator
LRRRISRFVQQAYECVVVVDDDPAIAEVAGGYLREAGLEPWHAADRPSAPSLAGAWPPDIVISGLMPRGGSSGAG